MFKRPDYRYFFALFLLLLFPHFAVAELGGLGILAESHEKGLKVLSVLPNSPASKAGLKPEDVITKINDQPVSSGNFFSDLKKLKGPVGDIVHVTIIEPRHENILRVGIVRAAINERQLLEHAYENDLKDRYDPK